MIVQGSRFFEVARFTHHFSVTRQVMDFEDKEGLSGLCSEDRDCI